MLAHELASLLMKHPDAEVTVSVWDGDYCLENEVDGVTVWADDFVSIQHSRRTRSL